MNKTKIDWADRTWNPVTGCFHNCPYCYAARIAHRYGLHFAPTLGDPGTEGACKYDTREGGENSMLELQKPYNHNPYPMGFAPTFHRYRLEEPLFAKKPQNIFVCSMADLFGEWVPDEWIEAVFEACEKAPQHRYLFLTKNPKRYIEILKKYPIIKHWLGTTIVDEHTEYFYSDRNNAFLSIEPIQSSFTCSSHNRDGIKWVIVGAETGNRKGKIIPKRGWIENIVNNCLEQNVPVFMKDSLKEIWGEQLIQEYPLQMTKSKCYS